jgi:hypothetical protein
MKFWTDIHFIVLFKPHGSAGPQGMAFMFSVYAYDSVPHLQQKP